MSEHFWAWYDAETSRLWGDDAPETSSPPQSLAGRGGAQPEPDPSKVRGTPKMSTLPHLTVTVGRGPAAQPAPHAHDHQGWINGRCTTRELAAGIRELAWSCARSHPTLSATLTAHAARLDERGERPDARGGPTDAHR